MAEINIITTVEQQREVYAALKDNPKTAANWEFMARNIIGFDEETIAQIKGED